MTPVALAELALQQGDSADTSTGKQREATECHTFPWIHLRLLKSIYSCGQDLLCPNNQTAAPRRSLLHDSLYSGWNYSLTFCTDMVTIPFLAMDQQTCISIMFSWLLLQFNGVL